MPARVPAQGGLQCHSGTQALSIATVCALQSPLKESRFPRAVLLQMGPHHVSEGFDTVERL